MRSHVITVGIVHGIQTHRREINSWESKLHTPAEMIYSFYFVMRSAQLDLLLHELEKIRNPNRM